MRRNSAIALVSFMLLFSMITGVSQSSASEVSFKAKRPYTIFVPGSYNKSKPAPLILALHGYTSSGDEMEKFLQLTPVAQAKGILYVHPDGAMDSTESRFWNATPACCNLTNSSVDDDKYLMSIIDEVSKKYNVDQKRIFIIGHSNGGFMAHHMACAHPDRIAAIASLAGATYDDPSACKAKQPVSVLQIWGTADATINYMGGYILDNPYPGAAKTIASWAKIDKCLMRVVPLKRTIDIESTIPGNETTVGQYQGCAKKTTVELWTMKNGFHTPNLVPTFAANVVDFLLAHPKVN